MFELERATNDLKELNEDTGRLMTIFNVKLEAVKKIGNADVVVGVDKSSKEDEPLVVVRNQDPNKSHPLRRMDVLNKIPTLHRKHFTSHTFQAIVWKFNVKSQSRYFWGSSEGAVKKYSNDVLTFVQNLTPNDVEAARKDYREHLRRQKKTSGK